MLAPVGSVAPNWFCSFILVFIGPQVQVDRELRLDHFTELPVSLVLLCLICVDVVERIRTFRLTGKGNKVHSL